MKQVEHKKKIKQIFLILLAMVITGCIGLFILYLLLPKGC